MHLQIASCLRILFFWAQYAPALLFKPVLIAAAFGIYFIVLAGQDGSQRQNRIGMSLFLLGDDIPRM
jgi:hypothetical protein